MKLARSKKPLADGAASTPAVVATPRRAFGLGRKMVLAFAAIGTLVMTVGIVGIKTAATLNAGTEDLFEGDIVTFQDIIALELKVADVQRDVTQLPGLIDNRATLKSRIQSFAAADKDVSDLLDKIAASDDPDVVAAANAFRAVIATLNAVRDDEVLPLIGSGNAAGAERVIETKVDAAIKAAVKAQTELGMAQQAASAETEEAGHSAFKRSLVLTITLTALAVMLAVVLALALANRVTRRLRRLINATQAIAQGDLSHRADIQSRDELQQLATAFNDMAAQLEHAKSMEITARQEGQRLMAEEYEVFAQRVAGGDLTARVRSVHTEFASLAENMNGMVNGLGGMSGEVREVAKEMAGATSQILTVVSQHNAAASEQAASIAETSVTVDEVRATSQQAAERAQQLADQASDAATASAEGRAAIDGIASGMSDIRLKVEEIARDILTLSDRTQAIQDITQTVNDLADQSNMLALNATIEAAKAGEHGKGFAVVANEVRALAEQSKAATARVRDILAEIQQASDKAVAAAEEGTRVVESGAAGARDAGLAIERIGATVHETAQVASQIAASAKEQSVGMEQVGQAMSDIASTTHQISRGADQTQDAARSLADLADRLDELTSRYILADTPAAWRAPERDVVIHA
jgi:methyl-accepting chemotaxis protein